MQPTCRAVAATDAVVGSSSTADQSRWIELFGCPVSGKFRTSQMTTLTPLRQRRVISSVKKPVTAAEALNAAKEPSCYLVCVLQSEASLFHGPGWTRSEAPCDGGVLFVHRERELLAVRASGIL